VTDGHEFDQYNVGVKVVAALLTILLSSAAAILSIWYGFRGAFLPRVDPSTQSVGAIDASSFGVIEQIAFGLVVTALLLLSQISPGALARYWLPPPLTLLLGAAFGYWLISIFFFASPKGDVCARSGCWDLWLQAAIALAPIALTLLAAVLTRWSWVAKGRANVNYAAAAACTLTWLITFSLQQVAGPGQVELLLPGE